MSTNPFVPVPLYRPSSAVNKDVEIFVDERVITAEHICNELNDRRRKSFVSVDEKQRAISIILRYSVVILQGSPFYAEPLLKSAIQDATKLKPRDTKGVVSMAYYHLGYAFHVWESNLIVGVDKEFPSTIVFNPGTSLSTIQNLKQTINSLVESIREARYQAHFSLAHGIRRRIINTAGSQYEQPLKLEFTGHRTIASLPLPTPLLCPFCCHAFVDESPDNQSNIEENTKILQHYVKATLEMEQESRHPSKYGIKKRAPDVPTVFNGGLKEVSFQCHCFQMNKMSCNYCNGGAALVDEMGVSDCPVCNCGCNRRWLVPTYRPLPEVKSQSYLSLS
jgi:hypothetical protein